MKKSKNYTKCNLLLLIYLLIYLPKVDMRRPKSKLRFQNFLKLMRYSRNSNDVEAYLIKYRDFIDLEKKDEYGETILFRLCQQYDAATGDKIDRDYDFMLEIVDMLLRNGANMYTVNNKGEMPLTCHRIYGHIYPLARVFRDNGYDFSVKDNTANANDFFTNYVMELRSRKTLTWRTSYFYNNLEVLFDEFKVLPGVNNAKLLYETYAEHCMPYTVATAWLQHPSFTAYCEFYDYMNKTSNDNCAHHYLLVHARVMAKKNIIMDQLFQHTSETIDETFARGTVEMMKEYIYGY